MMSRGAKADASTVDWLPNRGGVHYATGESGDRLSPDIAVHQLIAPVTEAGSRPLGYVPNHFLLTSLLTLFFVACGGHGGGGGGGGANGPTTYTIGGTVSGLSGNGLVLQNHFGNATPDNLPVSANGRFTFITALPSGEAYDATVYTQPSNPSQTCTVTGGSGQVSGANVTSIQIACATNAYTIGGTVSGLSGTGLVLQDNGGNDLSVGNGGFAFTAAIASGSSYDVTVLTQPPSPAQFCEVGNASGQVGGANVTNIQVTCTANTTGAPVSINWTNVHQQIDGFGASNAFHSASMTAANQNLFFGTGPGQLGLTLLRVGVTDGSGEPGSCLNIDSSCAGPYGSDMQAVIAHGGRVIATPWTPPAAYKTNGLPTCSNNAGLATAHYGDYATWLANFVKSVQAQYGVTLYAISVQNEPDICANYDTAYWTAANIDDFVKNNLGPRVAADGLSTLIFAPETASYYALTVGSTCGADPSCYQYVGGINWHDYFANLSGTNTVAANPYPSGWPAGKKYWETEVSCFPSGPNFCQPGFHTDMANALDWAAVIDQRIAVDGANAWLYWFLIGLKSTDDEGLMASNGTIAKRAYMMGQYSRFVRPGYFRIDATHLPEPGVSVSAYQDTATNTLVVIVTNFSSSADSQTFNISNAPAFSAVTPWITSANWSLEQQASVPISANSFTYLLPPHSITTFVSTP